MGSLAIELTSVEQARLDNAFRPGSAEGSRYPASMRTLDTDEKHDLTVVEGLLRHGEDTVSR